MLSTILIVDGDFEQRQTLKHTISEKLKYNTLTASDGQEAINLILSADTVTNLMLLDMRTLKKDAVNIIQFIKLHRPYFPIITLIGYDDYDYAKEVIAAGTDDYMAKPATIERLGLSITNMLRLCHLRETIKKLEARLAASSVNISQSTPFFQVRKLRSIEEEAIRSALNIYDGSMSKAARSLGIGRSTLYRKVSEMNRHQNTSNYIARENHTTRPTMVISEMEHS